ncbi:oxygen-dependent coproporphyrinogen oxidase [Cytobacillus horneckiae]|uniref:oxygen-dependent coproporphyrinogen oxidase n=1 Tax=Cytobacillus horneckiae TaxID=549687 RepID=UPI003D9A17FA
MAVSKIEQPSSIKIDKTFISQSFENLQDSICSELEKLDGKAVFKEEKWNRPGGGGGRARVIENGHVFQKGGVNFSNVHGLLSEKMSVGLGLAPGHEFFATGVSIILHPSNPFIPIIHMNVRYFEMSNGDRWFGGGIDLTPIYINVKQAKYFHQCLKTLCERHNESYYQEFKVWADNYFYLKHRNETRGIGGIFFDRLTITPQISLEERYAFVKEVGESFIRIYKPLVEENMKPFGEDEKRWQLLRRGRYVEFNLIYDRGTKFGLDTNGRIESIFMSLPPEVNWLYNYQPLPNSEEAFTLNMLRKGIDWVNLENK